MNEEKKTADLAQRVADLGVELEKRGALLENSLRRLDELRARLTDLERQEPVAWQFPLVIGLPDVAHTAVKPYGELAHLATPLYARPVHAIPDGWKLVKVKAAEFDNLMYWLDRCESKGHMEQCSDLIEPWYAFEYADVAAPEHKA